MSFGKFSKIAPVNIGLDLDPFVEKETTKEHRERNFVFEVPQQTSAPMGEPTVVQFYKAVPFANRLAIYVIDQKGKTYKLPINYYNRIYVQLNNTREYTAITQAYSKHIVKSRIVERDLMQNYSPVPLKFAEIYISCAVQFFHTLLGREFGNLSIHEEKIPIDNKFFTEYNLEYSGVYEIYDIERYDLKDLKTTPVWYDPTHIVRAKPVQIKPRIGYFDIETACLKGFPREYLIEDVITIISFIIDHPDGKTEKHCYIVSPIKFGSPKDDFKTHTFAKEKDMIEAFLNHVVSSGINILTGYNILKFDLKYIFWRCLMHGINIGTTIVYKKSTDEYIFNSPSIVCIDLFKFVKSHVPLTELSSYKLKDVCKFYNLDQGKIDMEYEFMFKTFRGLQENPEQYREDYKNVIDYCVRDSEVLSALYDKLQIWLTFTAFSNIHYASIEIIANEGAVRKLTNLIYRWMSFCGYVFVPNNGEKINYEGGFVHLSAPGYHTNVAIVDFASLYPSLIISNNLCPTTIVHSEDPVPSNSSTFAIDYKIIQEAEEDEYQDNYDEDEEEEENAVIVPKKQNVFSAATKTRTITVSKEVHVVPTSLRRGVFPQILSFLLSQRKKVKKVMEQHEENYTKAKLENQEARENHQPVPHSDEELAKLSFLFLENEKNQLALKITANSLYGICCARGAISCMEVGIVTTMLGRQAIRNVNTYLEGKGYPHIYSDTDSSMVEVGDCSDVSTPEKLAELGIEATEKALRLPLKLHVFQKEVDELNTSHRFYTDPMKLEFETFADVGVWLKKKFYVCYIKSELKYKTRGTVDRRSDKPEVLKRLFRELYRQILYNHDLNESVMIVVRCIESLPTLPFSDFEISKGFRGIDKYANPESAPMVTFVHNAERHGVKIEAGSRVRYVMANECYAAQSEPEYIEALRNAKTGSQVRALLSRPGFSRIKAFYINHHPEYREYVSETGQASTHESDYWATAEMNPTINYRKYLKFMSQQINTMLQIAYPEAETTTFEGTPVLKLLS